VIDKKILRKIQRVYHCKTKIKKPSGKIYSYRFWWGFWDEGGETKKVYVGRELPDELKELMKWRVPSGDGGQFWWPKSKKGVFGGDPGLIQVRGR